MVINGITNNVFNDFINRRDILFTNFSWINFSAKEVEKQHLHHDAFDFRLQRELDFIVATGFEVPLQFIDALFNVISKGLFKSLENLIRKQAGFTKCLC